MNEFNLKEIESAISTQYTDYKGIAAIDTHDGTNLFDLAKDYGVDTDKFFVYGASCFDSEPIGREELSVTLFLIDKDTYGSSIDEISKYHGTISVVTKRIRIPYSKLGKYIKHINIGVVSSLSAHITVQMPEEY